MIEFPFGRTQFERVDGDERRSAATEERLRIARELHDVVAYSFAAIKVQTGVALHLLDGASAAIVEPLQAIDAATKQALDELRQILGQLRSTDAVAPLGTAPGVEELGGLAATMSAAGVQTQVIFYGERRSLPPAVDFTLFRIAQESLSNVLRHAGSTSAVVTLVYESDCIVLQVENEPGEHLQTPEPGSGYGIAGMQERASAIGGRLEVGPRSSGGFRVKARLPLLPRS